MLHCIISNIGLTERYSFVSFEGKKFPFPEGKKCSTNTAQYQGKHRTTGNVKINALLLKEVLVIFFHLLPPNLSSILVDTFRNMGISEFYPHRYMNRYIYRYIDQIFLLNKVITSHYQ